jgi:CxxC motif-containing protein (DUF1111 family)
VLVIESARVSTLTRSVAPQILLRFDWQLIAGNRDSARRSSMKRARDVAAAAISVSVMWSGASARADFGDPLANLTAAQEQAFLDGKTQFEHVEAVADGLGPVFNENACVVCHASPSGGNGFQGHAAPRLETRFGSLTNGVFDPLKQLDGSLLHNQGIGFVGAFVPPLPEQCLPPFEFVGETVPAEANVTALRRSNALFGLGLVDATPDQTFVQLAASEAAQNPSVAGVVAFVINADTGQRVVGKFGWKAQNATLHEFAGDAYLGEMGVTNPSFPHENCPGGNCALLVCNPDPALNDDGGEVQSFTDFMTLLAPPPPGTLPPPDKEGQIRFNKIGCADCHTPTLTSGPNPIAALANQTFNPYSDFLLHDMGSLGDGIAQAAANGRQMRTAPLWGVREQTALLHDGRAGSIAQAIQFHDGQAAAARDKFLGLNATQQAKVIAFVNSL